MASADVVTAARKEGPLANPWPWLIAGLIAVGLGWLCGEAFRAPMGVRGLLVVVGVVAAGAAVAIRPASEKVLLGAAVAAFLGCLVLLPPGGRAAVRSGDFDSTANWDSIRLVLAIAALVAAAAALLVALPRLWRRVVVSLLVVVHFGGILSAVLSPQPGPWIAGMAYTFVYRPYLEFMYLTNAYHFYAPDPGPQYYMWFWVDYDAGDGKVYWKLYKVPDLDENGWPQYDLALQYQRRLAMGNLTVQTTQPVDAATLLEASKRREQANLERYKAGKPIIPRHPDPRVVQYAPPVPVSAFVLQSYVRHVAHQFHRSHPEAVVLRIKLYRVLHKILDAGEYASGKDPNDWDTYYPYFWGEYDEHGRLRSKNDPFLYWQLPVIKVKAGASWRFEPNTEWAKALLEKATAKAIARNQMKPLAPKPEEDQFSIGVAEAARLDKDEDPKILNYFYLHAGDPKWVRHPGEVIWTEE